MNAQTKILSLIGVVGVLAIGFYAAKTIPGYKEAVIAPKISADTPIIPSVSADAPIRGNKDAANTIIEFGDYECPYCATSNDLLKQLVARYPDVRVVWKDCPLSQHPNAKAAAEAAHCAGDQGKYWEYHDTLLSAREQLGDKFYKSLATGMGLDAAAFNTCLDNGTKRRLVEASWQECAASGVTELPWIIANGQVYSGSNAAFGLVNPNQTP
jgi:protein-disulfide isomerase